MGTDVRRPRLGAISVIAVMIVSIGATGVATAVSRAGAPAAPTSGLAASAIRRLQRVGTSNVSKLSGTRAPRGYARMPDGDDDRATRALLNQAAASGTATLGGANAPASRVVGNGPSAQGFDALDLVQMEKSGDGTYADTNGGLEPPDQALCVGNGFVMEGVNQSWRVYNRAGQPVTKPVPITQFFKIPPSSATPPSSFVSDPRCVYDAQSHRFFALTLEADESNGLTAIPFLRAHTYIAVSKTSDPTKDWWIYSIDVTDDGQHGTPFHPTCPCIDDQPLIGFDANGLYVSANQYSDSEILPVPLPGQANQVFGTLPDYRNGQAQLYAMSKQALISGHMPPVAYFDTASVPLPAEDKGKTGALWSSLQPSSPPPGDPTPTAANGAEYFMSQLDFLYTGDHRVAVWAITNTATLSAARPAVRLTHTIVNTRSGTYTAPIYGVDQKNGPHPLGDQCGCPEEQLNANDDRMNAVTLINGTLWSGVNTALPPINANGTGAAADKRAGIMYFAVTPSIDAKGNITASMLRDGYVQVPRNNVIFPSIAANPGGAVAMFFTLTGVDYFPSAAWARLDGVAPGTGPDVHLSGAGAQPEDGFTGYPTTNQLGVPLDTDTGKGVARWGDYSYAATDEAGCLWGAAEYIPGTERDPAAGNWGTYVTRIATTGCNAPAIAPLLPNLNTNPCGPLFTDASADDVADSDIAAVGTTKGNNPQLDILKGAMSLSPDGRTLSTTLTVRNMSTKLAPGSTANEYYVYWDFGGKTYITNAEVSPSGTTFRDGTFDADGRNFRSGRPADTGKVVPGPNGTVTVNVPLSVIGSPRAGDILKAVNAESRALTAVIVLQYDRAGPKFDFQLGQLCT